MEREIKLSLSEAEHRRLIASLPDPTRQQHLVNHYFDTWDLTLQNAGAMLRVREGADGGITICFKRGRSFRRGEFEAEEYEQALDRRAWKRIRRHSRLDLASHPVARLARHLSSDGHLRRLGATYVRRRSYDAGRGATLELDEVTFEDGSRDWELELEAQDPARFLPDLRELLDDHEIAWRAQTRTKYRRFLDRHRPHPERVWRRLLDRGDLLGVWLALVAIAGVLAYDRSGDVVNVLGVDFKTPQAVAAALVGLNFFLILVSRGADARRRLGGVRSLYHEQASGYLRRMGWPASSAAPLKHDIERGTGNAITKLSIMSAIAAGMVAILLQLPGADQPVAGDDLLRQVAVLGLSVTVVCMLIAILCYDYSQRFTWPDALRLELHRKGFRYDVWSWYGLLIFFILALATVHPIISIVVNGIYGVILWHFYYFSREAVTTLVASTRAP